MKVHDLIGELREDAPSKIVLVVADGLGGLAVEPGGRTELESARTPHLDSCARDGVCGLSIPVLPGITPGSGPGHLALFGYDPLEHRIGRGVLEAMGVQFDLGPDDVAARGNFCTVDASGRITDRRAGRLSTEQCLALCQRLSSIRIPDMDVFVEPVREHRFVVVFRGSGLGSLINDTDPQTTGVVPLPAVGSDGPSQVAAAAVNRFVSEAAKLLHGQGAANMVMLRGFARVPDIRSLNSVFGLRAVAIAVYPMYRGLARIVGMDVAESGTTLGEQIDTLEKLWSEYDYFFLHYKYSDSTGEDGNFAGKVETIERLDAQIPRIRALGPTVLIVTGDHSTPARLKSHSWHPVPTVLVAKTARSDRVTEFGEEMCLRGGLGQFEAKHLMTLAMAHAGRLGKFGA